LRGGPLLLLLLLLLKGVGATFEGGPRSLENDDELPGRGAVFFGGWKVPGKSGTGAAFFGGPPLFLCCCPGTGAALRGGEAPHILILFELVRLYYRAVGRKMRVMNYKT